MSKPFDPVKFAAGVHDYIGKALAPLVARVAALEQAQTKSLADAYRGAWLPGRYERGALCSHAGSLWLCIEDGDGKPGGSASWRLIVKGSRE
jgi:hypothetical protein